MSSAATTGERTGKMPIQTKPVPWQDPKCVERFWNFVEKGSDGDCWEWQGRINNLGYGTLKVDRRPVGAHRMALALGLGRDLYNGS